MLLSVSALRRLHITITPLSDVPVLLLGLLLLLLLLLVLTDQCRRWHYAVQVLTRCQTAVLYVIASSLGNRSPQNPVTNTQQHSLIESIGIRARGPGASKPRVNDAFCVIGNVGESGKILLTGCVLRPVDASKCVCSSPGACWGSLRCSSRPLPKFGGGERGRQWTRDEQETEGGRKKGKGWEKTKKGIEFRGDWKEKWGGGIKRARGGKGMEGGEGKEGKGKWRERDEIWGFKLWYR